jgi:hypothetical protein
MGLLNLRVDVPKAMTAQNKRLCAIAELAGRLGAVMKAQNARPTPADEVQQIARAKQAASAMRPVARKLRKEAAGFQSETVRFSGGLDRWLEIAERNNTGAGLAGQVPALARMLTSGTNVLPSLKEKRQMFEKLRGASDTMDVSCGEVVEAFDLIIGSTEGIVSACESALKKIRAILERSLVAP